MGLATANKTHLENRTITHCVLKVWVQVTIYLGEERGRICVHNLCELCSHLIQMECGYSSILVLVLFVVGLGRSQSVSEPKSSESCMQYYT